jgi:hypothetical protein
MVLLTMKILDRGFLIQEGDDYVPIVRYVLLADNDIVPGQNPCLDHALALNAEGETGVSVAGCFLIDQAEVAIEVLLGKDWVARRDLAQDRNRGSGEAARRGTQHLDGSHLARHPLNVALGLYRVEVLVHPSTRAETDRPADLAHRGRPTLFLLRLNDIVQDIPLPVAELVCHL